ncbi:MAG: TerB family tellurite resistance protein [Limisphaerales bacterium]
MTLPTLLAEDFEKFSGRAPDCVARALYNLDGTLGATWMATDGFYLVFYYKPSGGNYCRKAFSISDALRVEAKTEDCFAVFRARFPEAAYELKFSLWDISTIDRIARYWNPDKTEIMGTPPAELRPLNAFCAGIHVMLQADAKTEEVELEWLSQRIPDQTAIQEGCSWLAANGPDQLMQVLPDVMSVQQRECLLANQISVAMTDGVLRSAEQELIEKFRAGMQLKKERFQSIFDALLIKNRIITMFGDTADGLLDLSSSSPLVISAACLIAMSECDEEKHETEEGFLKRLIAREEVMKESTALLEFKGLEGLIETLGDSLNGDQRRCLMANLLGLAMVDGELKVDEQELIGRFQKAMNITDDDFHWFLEVLLAKNNLSVLVAAP